MKRFPLLAAVTATLTACAARTVPAPQVAQADAPPATATSDVPPAPAPSTSATTSFKAASTESDIEKKDGEETRKYMWRVGGWITLAVAAGAGVVALGTSYLMIHNASVRSGHCQADRTCDSTGLAANQMVDSLGGWNLGSWIVAIAGTAIGAYILVTHPDGRGKDNGTTAIGVSPNGSGLGLEMRRTF